MNTENFGNVISFENKKLEDLENQENIEKGNEEQELSERIKQEQQEAKEKFGDLIGKVSQKYEKLSPEMQKEFILHNEEILNDAIELGIKKELSKEELEKLELSSILHDIAKADSAPEEYADIPNYVLATHAETAAKEVPNILTDEYLKEKNIQGDPEMIRQEVAKAISEHMGPHPGFMTGILNGVNAKLKEKGKEEIKHPQAEGKISEALLAADMRSLAGEKGRKKVLAIRSSVEFFIGQDKALVEEYKKFGIDLSQGEAALLSGFDSAYQARDMQKDKENYAWVNESIEKSKEVEYKFPGSEKAILWKEADAKRRKFEELRENEKRLEAVRERLEKLKKAA